jgi:glutamate 5-kinase
LNLTDDDNPINEISRIEAQLEELAEVAEQCRKIILVSKTAIVGAVALMLFVILGLLGSSQVVAAIGSIAVVLGGIVVLGSNVSTLRQTMAAMSALRSDLISRIELRLVGDSTGKSI